MAGYVPNISGLTYTVPLLKDKNSCKYLWFSALGYIINVFHLELFLCLHVRLICALNYYLLTYLLTYLKADDFRGISISCVMSKVFEHRVFDRFNTFLATVY